MTFLHIKLQPHEPVVIFTCRKMLPSPFLPALPPTPSPMQICTWPPFQCTPHTPAHMLGSPPPYTYPVSPAYVYNPPPANPCQWTPANQAALSMSLYNQLGQPQTSPPPAPVRKAPMVVRRDRDIQPSAKRGAKERAYSEQQMRDMIIATLRRDRPSAALVAADAGFLSAKSCLHDYVREIKDNTRLRGATPQLTLAAQVAHASTLTLKTKGNEGLLLRRIFSKDERDFFARSLKRYGDLGWPMDTALIQEMMSTAAKKMGLVDWKRGQPFVVSECYVRKFIKKHPDLSSFKTSHIDPLRAKKGTRQVRDASRGRRAHQCTIRSDGPRLSVLYCPKVLSENISSLFCAPCANLIYFSLRAWRGDWRTQVQRNFVALIDDMMAKLYARGQDPDDHEVPSTFRWSTFESFPAAQKFNMDEVGSDTNAGRKKAVMHAHTQADGLARALEETDGDNKQFHVTVCLTTCAAGTTPIPPYIGHSAPHSTAVLPKVPRELVSAFCEKNEDTGKWTNASGINVFVTKNGSMTKAAFPGFCRHFVNNLPAGQGKGGEPVILVFDGHASRWNFLGLKYLMENNVFCLCLPGHTSIWAQPNDGGVNASWKSTLGAAIRSWRNRHRALPGSEKINKMRRADFNEIVQGAWLAWEAGQHTELVSPAGGNAIVTSWKGTGLEPYDRSGGLFWSAAIAKFGHREELAGCSDSTTDAVGEEQPARAMQSTRELTLAAAFAARAGVVEAAKLPAPTDKLPMATAPASTPPSLTTTVETSSPDSDPAHVCTQLVPANATERSTMVSAVDAAREVERLRAYAARLGGMCAGEQMELRDKATQIKVSLSKTDDGFILVRPGHGVEQLTLDAARDLSDRFVIPAPTREQLSDEEATLVRRRAARQAATARAAEREAAVQAAEQLWAQQQADLAWELGISFEGWQRIVTLLSKAPAARIGNQVVMHSVAAGRAIVIDAAVAAAVAEPLHESVRAAAERASKQEEAGKRGREPGLEQTLWGMNVTEMMPKFEARDQKTERDAAQKRQKTEEDATEAAAKKKARTWEASSKLMHDKGGDPNGLAIKDLLTLIMWHGGKPPADTSKANKALIVAAWTELAVPPGVIQAQADQHPQAGGAARAAARNGKGTRAPRARGSGDDDESEEEEDGDDDDGSEEEDGDEDEEDNEDEDEEDEEPETAEDTYNAEYICAQSGTGRNLQYEVKWEGYEETSWEPPSHMEGTEALEAWVESGKKAWERAKREAAKAKRAP